jgi:riboflavin kinase / FMN adenylyltransferase
MAEQHGRVIAIGNFDGVHRGHQRLVQRTVELAAEGSLIPAALTFSPHPARVLAPDRAPPLLISELRRIELLRELGLGEVVTQAFTRELAALSPEAFVSDLLVGQLSARAVCVGYDFSFGHKRSGTVDTLVELGQRLGISVAIVPAVRVRSTVCSSTAIRGFIASGQVQEAAALLGRPVELEGVVVHGAQRGRTIGFPTINLAVENEVQPRGGVYAGRARLSDGRTVRAAINVGTNPTFTDERKVHVEAYLLDVSEDLYGARVRLFFDERLRDELKFDGVEALVAQMDRDVATTRSFVVPVLPDTD